MRGDNDPKVEDARYYKFSWNSSAYVPQVGARSYVPQESGAFRMYAEGSFRGGTNLCSFPAVKKATKLPAMDRCVFCNRSKDQEGKELRLTSEHVIPEFLGAGLELPNATCDDCQKVSSAFESTIAQEMFDPVRKSFSLGGKSGELPKTNFPLDIGRETSDRHMIPLAHHPTILVMPALYPASAYSNRPSDTDGVFNFIIYNINARPEILEKYNIDGFSTQSIDMARFCQLVAKIAHVYVSSINRDAHYCR